MEELSKRLLTVLLEKGFQKNTTLASMLGVSESTIRRHMSALRSSGTIKIIALRNPVLFGYKAWAKIGIVVKPNYLEQVASELVRCPLVYFVAYGLGTFDIMIAVHFKSIEGLTYFVNSRLTSIEGIQRTETMMLMQPRKYYDFSWPAPLFKKNRVTKEYYLDTTNSPDQYKVDEIDQRILGVLAEDGLGRPASLKSRLGIGESTIRKHIANMLKNEVFRIVVVPDPEVLEYEVWATMGIVINHQFAHKVIDAAVKDPAVYLASLSVGRFNSIIAARFHNVNMLNQFVKKKLPSIEGVVSVEVFLHNKPLKYHNIAWYNLSKL